MTHNDFDVERSERGTLDRDGFERRLEAVERALSEDEPVDRADRLDDLEARVAELEAAVQAIRGYVGTVRAVNEEIEQRSELALRTARAVRRHVASEPADRDGANGSGDDEAAMESTGSGDDNEVLASDSGAQTGAGARTLAKLRRRL